MKFFIIDDDPDILLLMQVLLEGEGHTVDTNFGGLRGLAEIDSRRPDCLIVDLMMATIDGLELCRLVRERRVLDKTRIIVVSGRSQEKWGSRVIDAGAQGFIQKPFTQENFIQQVYDILEIK